MGVAAIDKTGAAFNSVKMRARATGASIRAALGGALAAAGAYLSVRSVVGAINELGMMSDVAQKTNTSVAELTKTLTALQILGINTDMNSLARAFQMMEKNTGKSGLSGFYEVVAEIGKIPDAAERGKRAMAVFGRSGLEFMPIINAAKEGTAAIEGVIGAMPGVPQKAAEAGDKVNDAMKTVGEEFHSIWLQAIGAVCDLFDKQFAGGVREAALKVSAYLEYWAKATVPIFQSAWRRIQGYGEAIGGAVGAWWGASSTQLGTQGEVWQAVKDAWESAINEMDDDLEGIEGRLDQFAERLKTRLEKASGFQIKYNKAAGSGDSTPSDNPTNNPTAAGAAFGVAAAKRITNELIMGGSNAANRLAALGPQYQNEIKKIAEGVAKIAQNTKKTAENTEEGGEQLAATDL